LNLTSTNVVGLAIGDTIPSGAVMAFNLANCPIGWSEANGTSGNPDLRGEFIRGLDNGRGVDSGRVLASWQEPTRHVDIDVNSNGYALHPINTYNQYADSTSGVSASRQYSGGTQQGTQNSWYISRPRNVALLYCVKD